MHRPFFVPKRVLLMKRYARSNCTACGFAVKKSLLLSEKWTGLDRFGPRWTCLLFDMIHSARLEDGPADTRGLFSCLYIKKSGGQRMVILIIVEGLVIFIYADAPMEPPVCGMEVCGCPR